MFFAHLYLFFGEMSIYYVLKSSSMILTSLFCLCKFTFTVIRLLCHINFRINLSVATKIPTGILIGITVHLLINLERIGIYYVALWICLSTYLSFILFLSLAFSGFSNESWYLFSFMSYSVYALTYFFLELL